MQLLFCNRNDKQYQKQLNSLLKPIFLDFTFWYDLDLWDQNYESYSIMHAGEIVSNICVYKTDVMFRGKQHRALSIGAVATKEEYRGSGYAGTIMEHILNKYPNTPMYLAANESVVDFYPRYGFERIEEHLPVAHYLIDNTIAPQKIQYSDPKVWNHVYKQKNFSTALDCQNTACITMFHIYEGYLKDCIYEIPTLDTTVIATQDRNTLKIIGVFSLRDISFFELAQHLPFQNVSTVEFGFMPYWSDLRFEMQPYETDPLFVRNIACELGDFKFPELSMT